MTLNGLVKHAIITWLKTEIQHVLLLMVWYSNKNQHSFYLNELECRLLALRIALKKLMQAPGVKQLKIYGNIVNVLADVINTVSVLPRLPGETGTIKVNLNRNSRYKSSVTSFNVRPHKVVEAALWLISSISLYKDEGIVLNQDWIINYNEEILQLENESDNTCDQQSVTADINSNNINEASQEIDGEDEWSEDDVEIRQVLPMLY